MPELPEVETTRRGLEPLIVDRKITSVHIYKKKLRWEIPKHLIDTLKNQTIQKISRRAKYLLIDFVDGQLVMHLGMTGSISVVPAIEPLKKHHHFELKLDNNSSMRFHDPRRFGSILWQKNDEQLSLLEKLGPEPLSYEFDENSLFNPSIGKTKNIKTFIMDSSIVVGVGNIYASESLSESINNGGTTLNDFSNVDGEAGYFYQILSVYDRKDMSCNRCDGKIKKIVQNQRATYYCPKCQH
jgi:formamidopyrimidine-DNA glycosylase